LCHFGQQTLAFYLERAISLGAQQRLATYSSGANNNMPGITAQQGYVGYAM